MPPKQRRSADDVVESSTSKKLRTTADEIDAERAAWAKEKAGLVQDVADLTEERDEAQGYLEKILEKQFQFIAFYNGASFLNRLINSKIQNLKKGKSAAEDQVKSLQADMADSKVSELKKEIKDLKLDLQVKEQTLSIHHKGKVEAENKIKRLEATLSTVSKAIEADLPKST